jgi:hypothetical protein
MAVTSCTGLEWCRCGAPAFPSHHLAQWRIGLGPAGAARAGRSPVTGDAEPWRSALAEEAGRPTLGRQVGEDNARP